MSVSKFTTLDLVWDDFYNSSSQQQRHSQVFDHIEKIFLSTNPQHEFIASKRNIRLSYSSVKLLHSIHRVMRSYVGRYFNDKFEP